MSQKMQISIERSVYVVITYLPGVSMFFRCFSRFFPGFSMVFSRMRSKGSRFTLEIWGLRGWLGLGLDGLRTRPKRYRKPKRRMCS